MPQAGDGHLILAVDSGRPSDQFIPGWPYSFVEHVATEKEIADAYACRKERGVTQQAWPSTSARSASMQRHCTGPAGDEAETRITWTESHVQ